MSKENTNKKADKSKVKDDEIVFLGFDAEYKNVGEKNIVLSQQFYGIAGEAVWANIYYIDETAEAQ